MRRKYLTAGRILIAAAFLNVAPDTFPPDGGGGRLDEFLF